MEKFQLTRKAMASLLFSLKNGEAKSPLNILQEAIQCSNNHQSNMASHHLAQPLLPTIFEKMLKIKEVDPGFSLNDIVALGNQIQFTKFSSTAVQNWVKRDVKEILGTPQKGRKYSIDQMILLFIVEDLKTVLDFDSIRKYLNFMFNDPTKRTDDLINPVKFYLIYTSIYEDLKDLNHEVISSIEMFVEKKAKEAVKEIDDLTEDQREVISLYIAVATLAVHASYIETIAKQFHHSTLFFVNS